MAEDVKVERVVDGNGRRVETRVYEVVVDGQKQRVIETHVEQIPMSLQERIVESIAPVVTNRKKEVYDKDGKVVESQVEELDNGSLKMMPAVAQQAPITNALTKEDLVEVLREVLNSREHIREVKSIKKVTKPKKVVAPVEEVEEEEETEPTPVTPITPKVSKLQEIFEVGIYVVLAGELAFCVYHLILKNWL
jgi:hypothetical protein